MDKRVTRIDLESVGKNGIMARFWFEGWTQPDAGASDIEDYIENRSISSLLLDYEKMGFAVWMARAGIGRALRGKITRVDILRDGVNWKVKKYPYGWTAQTRPIEERLMVPEEMQTSVQWLKDHKWSVLEWDGGYRAFKGEPMPVRDRAAILALRRRFMTEQIHYNYDLAFYF